MGCPQTIEGPVLTICESSHSSNPSRYSVFQYLTLIAYLKEENEKETEMFMIPKRERRDGEANQQLFVLGLRTL